MRWPHLQRADRRRCSHRCIGSKRLALRLENETNRSASSGRPLVIEMSPSAGPNCWGFQLGQMKPNRRLRCYGSAL
jgi:hypothetical protein